MINIKQACFTAVNACINNAFKVSNDPTIQGWHAGMTVMSILDQLSDLYGKPTPAMLEGTPPPKNVRTNILEYVDRLK